MNWSRRFWIRRTGISKSLPRQGKPRHKKKEADILEKARAEASLIVDQMKASIQVEAEEVRKTLKAQMTPLAQSITEKVLGRAIS